SRVGLSGERTLRDDFRASALETPLPHGPCLSRRLSRLRLATRWHLMALRLRRTDNARQGLASVVACKPIQLSARPGLSPSKQVLHKNLSPSPHLCPSYSASFSRQTSKQKKGTWEWKRANEKPLPTPSRKDCLTMPCRPEHHRPSG